MQIKNPRYANYWDRRTFLHPRGAGVTGSKLTAPKVMALRERAAQGEAYASLAVAYGIAVGTVSDIVHGRSWAHLPLVAKGA